MSCPKELTGLEIAVAHMFGVFMANEDENGKLSKEAFLKLLKDELPSFDQKNNGDELFKGVDLNEDGSVDFEEFAMMVAMFASASHDALIKALKAIEEKNQ